MSFQPNKWEILTRNVNVVFNCNKVPTIFMKSIKATYFNIKMQTIARND